MLTLSRISASGAQNCDKNRGKSMKSYQNQWKQWKNASGVQNRYKNQGKPVKSYENQWKQ